MRPKTELCSSWLVPQHSTSQRSSRLGQPKNLPHVRVVQIEPRQALEGVLDGQGDVVDVGYLVGQDCERQGKYPDWLDLAVAEIDHVASHCLLAEVFHQPDEPVLAQAIQGVLHPAGQGQSTQSQLLRGSKHLGSAVRVLRLVGVC